MSHRKRSASATQFESGAVVLPSFSRAKQVNTLYGSMWTNFEQALRLMERDEIAVDEIVDTSYSADEPAAAFEAFLESETCKPVFQFSD